MIVIRYCENGEAYSDFNYTTFVEMVMKAAEVFPDDERPINYRVSTYVPIIAVRTEIAKGKIDRKQIRIAFGDEEPLEINEYGNIIGKYNYKTEDLDLDLIRAQMKRKKEKEQKWG